jgi:hypothetical protein
LAQIRIEIGPVFGKEAIQKAFLDSLNESKDVWLKE